MITITNELLEDLIALKVEERVAKTEALMKERDAENTLLLANLRKQIHYLEVAVDFRIDKLHSEIHGESIPKSTAPFLLS